MSLTCVEDRSPITGNLSVMLAHTHVTGMSISPQARIGSPVKAHLLHKPLGCIRITPQLERLYELKRDTKILARGRSRTGRFRFAKVLIDCGDHLKGVGDVIYSEPGNGCGRRQFSGEVFPRGEADATAPAAYVKTPQDLDLTAQTWLEIA